jgi:hypothetical protein
LEDVLAILLIFGGGTACVLAFSPIGRAWADRLRYGKQPLPPGEADPAVYEELDRLRAELDEVHERLDFAERLLSKGSGAIPADPPRGEG